MQHARVLLMLVVVLIAGARSARLAHGKPLRLTLVGAQLEGTQVPRHAHPRSLAPASDLSCLSLPGLRHVAAACGGSMSRPAGVTPPLDPLLIVRLAGRVIRTYPIPGTLTPAWEYAVILDDGALDRDGQAEFDLLDAHAVTGEVLVGRGALPLRSLKSAGESKVPLGPIGALDLKVDELDAQKPPRRYQFFLPANRAPAELLRNARPGGYVPIPVAEGEVVHVTARGSVKPGARRNPQLVAGPAGIPTDRAKLQFNQPGFRGCPGCNHAALIAYIGAGGLVIGPERRFVVEHAGYLLLAVNDVRLDDNEGGYDVTVEVALPPAPPGVSLTGK